jgi:hypothetical protein
LNLEIALKMLNFTDILGGEDVWYYWRWFSSTKLWFKG